MTAPLLKNRVGMSTTTTGTGTVTVGAGLSAATNILPGKWLSLPGAGVADGSVVRYLIIAANGDVEWGKGTVGGSGTTLTRTLTGSTTGSLLSLSGTSQVFIGAVGEDIIPYDLTAGVLTNQVNQNAPTKIEIINSDTGASANATLSMFSGSAANLSISCSHANQFTQIGTGTGVFYVGTFTTDPLIAITNNAERMRVTGAGDLGIGTGGPARRLHVVQDDATANAVSPVMRLTHTTSGTPAIGIGVGLEFEAETAAATNKVGATIEAVTTDVTSGSEDFDLVFRTMEAGAAAAEHARFKSNGDVAFTTTRAGDAAITFTNSSTGAGSTANLGLNAGTGAALGIRADHNGGQCSINATTGYLALVSGSFILLANSGGNNGILTGTQFGWGTTSPDRQFHVEQDDATNSAVTYVERLTHTTSGTPAIGIGAGMEFEVETAAATNKVGATIEAITTAVGAGTEAFDLVFKTMRAGAAATEKMRLSSDGVHLPFLSGTGAGLWFADNTNPNRFFLGSDLANPDLFRLYSVAANANIYAYGSANHIFVGSLNPSIESATTNAVTSILKITSTSAGTPAIGIGAGISFEVETASSIAKIGATIEAAAYNVTTSSESFALNCKQMAANALQEAQGLSFLIKSLTANVAYTNNTSAQNWFATAGGVQLEGSTTYLFEGLLLQTPGATSHTVALSFAGTATLTSIGYVAYFAPSLVNATIATSNVTQVTTAAATVVTAAITTAGTVIEVHGFVRVNAAGTFIPQFTFSAAPGAGNVLANTFFKLRKIGSNTNVNQGNWA